MSTRGLSERGSQDLLNCHIIGLYNGTIPLKIDNRKIAVEGGYWLLACKVGNLYNLGDANKGNQS